jgi:hypothetical protein
MQPKLIKQSLRCSLAILCVAATVSLSHAGYTQRNGSEVQQSGPQSTRPIVVAGSQAVCQANYNQCMRGCGGAQSCNNQCMTNYNGCLR